ncbi:unnamed protein product [Aureobasidium vineae]|uniref:Uncharacterized protein n=1 Tax=Aureobasidium vineae TaxID=2773715 RepID=A0A9N8JBE7_9PEZI|nr:unnamed protein product [Aureobasidium vineae]
MANTACSYHATARLVSVFSDHLDVPADAFVLQSRTSGFPKRRSNGMRNKVDSEVNMRALVIKVSQQQHDISKSQAEILKSQHSNYHTLLEITENMQHTIGHIQTVKEDVQISDKIAFAAGFGCGLLVLLAIWISPFGGKDKDDDAEK